MCPHIRTTWLVLGVMMGLSGATHYSPAQSAEPRFPEIRRGKVFVRLAPDALAELQAKSFAHQSEVRDVILGTRIHGTCQTVGTAQIKPCENEQGFDLVVTGQCVTTSLGENGPATIHSTTTTDFTATSKIIFVREQGFQAGPVAVEARSHMKTNDIEAAQRGLVGRIVRGAAERRVADAKPIATEIARQKTSQRIESAIAAQLKKKLEKVNHSLDNLEKMVALLDPELTKDACLIVSKEHLLLYFHGEEVDHTALSRELPELTTNSELWVHAGVLSPELQARIAALTMVRDTAKVVADSATKLIETKISAPLPGKAEIAEVVADPLLDRHGDWIVVRVPATVAGSKTEDATLKSD